VKLFKCIFELSIESPLAIRELESQALGLLGWRELLWRLPKELRMLEAVRGCWAEENMWRDS